IHFKTVNVTTKKRALQEVGDAIKKIQKEETNPLMVVIQSQQPRLLRHDLPILQDLPMLPLKSDEDDKRLPPLGWQSFVAKRLVGHYL
ncbi:DNA polymerase epsilon catalytic subunit A, partial [Klebsiella pneumoniae]|nr:DNA polymerase epsilon catalytic subunit A [Klebsiella pneumoniae]